MTGAGVKPQVYRTSNRKLATRLAGFGLAGFLLGATTVRAGLVGLAPGGSVLLVGSAFGSPGGILVARQTAPFTAAYQPDGVFVNFSGFTNGQLDQQVFRDPKSGQLTFAYQIQLNN